MKKEEVEEMRYAVIALGAIGVIVGFYMAYLLWPMLGGISWPGMFGILGIILGIGLVLVGVKLRGK